MQHNAKIFFI